MPSMTTVAPSKVQQLSIGVLALQGAFHEHKCHLLQCDRNINVVEIRRREDLVGTDAAMQTFKVDGLIIPGGESTTISILAQGTGLLEPLQTWIRERRPTWGTCAGLILMAEQIDWGAAVPRPTFGGLDISVSRNYYGSQINSFTAPLVIHSKERADNITDVFIRAPLIKAVHSADVSILATHEAHGEAVEIVAVRQGDLMGTTFHPELTLDLHWHRLFVNIVQSYVSSVLNK